MEKMTYSEFKAKREAHVVQYAIDNPWASPIANDIITEKAYEHYLSGRIIPVYAK